MSNYRLSKYRPDVSSHDEWTSVSDIGRTHGGEDYIVYLGSDAVSDWLPPAGLYAEPMPSPHARISGE